MTYQRLITFLLINGDSILEPLQILNVMENFKVRHILLGFAMVSLFFNVKAAGGEDGTIVASSIDNKVLFEGILNVEEEIIEMRIFLQSNPSEFDELLFEESCTENNTKCIFSIDPLSLSSGIYVVEMYYTGSNNPVRIRYMHQ